MNSNSSEKICKRGTMWKILSRSKLAQLYTVVIHQQATFGEAVGALLLLFTPHECVCYSPHAGYESKEYETTPVSRKLTVQSGDGSLSYDESTSPVTIWLWPDIRTRQCFNKLLHARHIP